jgi:hypothetical protein
MSTKTDEDSDKSHSHSVAHSHKPPSKDKDTEIRGKDERIVDRAREAIAANAEAIKKEEDHPAKVGKGKVAVEIGTLQPAQAAEIGARAEEVRERKIDDARKRILEKEVAAA